MKALMLAVGLSWLVLQSAPVGAQCVDASKINPDNVCQLCLPGSSISAWSLQLAGAACSDERTCTSSDVCQADCSCAGSLLACDDGLPRTTEQCDEATAQCKVSVLSGCAIDQACWRSRTGTRR